MTTENGIIAAIERIIAEQLDLIESPAEIGPQTPLFDDGLELDSFGVVELISALETELSFEFREDDFQEEHFRTIGTLGRLIFVYLNDSQSTS